MAPNTDLHENALGHTIVPRPSSQTVSAANFAIFQNTATLDTYLLTQGYTQLTLNSMTKHDKTYAAKQKLNIL